MNSYVMAVFLSLGMGFALAFWAKKQNRDPYRWFLAGTFLSVLAVAAALGIQKKRKKR